jgi:hypothetical protein
LQTAKTRGEYAPHLRGAHPHTNTLRFASWLDDFGSKCDNYRHGGLQQQLNGQNDFQTDKFQFFKKTLFLKISIHKTIE